MVPSRVESVQAARGPHGPPHDLFRPPHRRFRLGERFSPRWLAGINVALGGLAMGELIAFGWLAIKPIPTVTVAVPPPPAPDIATGQQPATRMTPPDSTPSLASAVSRPLFRLEGDQGLSPTAPGPPTPSDQTRALVARFSVLGIVAGNPAQAIVEDAQTKKTYFVSVGQHVVEGLIVQDIRRDRVVLDFHGESIELPL